MSQHRSIPLNIEDKNERFVVRRCLIYLERLLCAYPMVDKEFVDILDWSLKEDMEQVIAYVTARIKDNKKVEFEEALLKCQGEKDEYSDIIIWFFRRSPQNVKSGFINFIVKLLNRRIEGLSYKGFSDIEKNVLSLKEMFHLTEGETEFCFLVFILTAFSSADGFFVDHLECNRLSGRKYLCTLLQTSQKEIDKVLRGTLARIGMFEMDNLMLRLEDDYLNFIQNSFDKTFSEKFFTRIPRSTVPLECHFVTQEQTEYILDLLKNKPMTSTHILLYGAPGTGKTSYAGGIAERLSIPAYEITRGEKNKTEQRRAAILACLSMTNSEQGSLILVDEADNLLNTRNSWLIRGETQDKGWLNQIMETPGARFIWITNTIDGVEDSVLRRFAYSLYFKPFNKKQRVSLWESILRRNKVKRLFSRTDIADLAKCYDLSAGAIYMAVKKAGETGAHTRKEIHKAVVMALDAYMALLNGGEKPIDKHRLEGNYSLDGLNTQGDLDAMMRQLERFDDYLQYSDDKRIHMNLLFYGPPGTGKSELARFIADHLKREIICKKASDILDPYVGGTEQNISRAFADAESKEAILVIDEVDSMLFSRGRAQRSWEISFTNEFLTQMERFNGILICTTNRITELDEASIRRFNHKVGFDVLKPEGNVTFYRKLLAPLISAPADKETLLALKRITGLAPGDFKTVKDRFSFYLEDSLSHHTLIQALEDEAEIKNLHGRKRKIGF